MGSYPQERSYRFEEDHATLSDIESGRYSRAVRILTPQFVGGLSKASRVNGSSSGDVVTNNGKGGIKGRNEGSSRRDQVGSAVEADGSDASTDVATVIATFPHSGGVGDALQSPKLQTPFQ